jgi:SAM-dependent methyltransferase
VNTSDPMAVYLSGERLYGDDLSPEAIERWFEDEREGYADLGAKDSSHYHYPYYALDRRHLFRHLPSLDFQSVLSIGGAYGHELRPLLGKIKRAVIVEPSEAFQGSKLGDLPLNYVKPQASGDLPFPDGSFDLACALSVLHHIPNVSAIIREMYRTLKPGGWALLREPTTSMGDWRVPRRGLTRHERGLPLPWFRKTLQAAGFKIVRETRCLNAITPRLGRWMKHGSYNSEMMVRFDSLLTVTLSWNQRYHAETFLDRLRPWAVAYVLQKP